MQAELRRSGYEELLSSGIVITGGSSMMQGMVELGEDIFLKPVRRGNPLYSGALSDMVANPRSATVMGLLEEARLARIRDLGMRPIVGLLHHGSGPSATDLLDPHFPEAFAAYARAADRLNLVLERLEQPLPHASELDVNAAHPEPKPTTAPPWTSS